MDNNIEYEFRLNKSITTDTTTIEIRRRTAFSTILLESKNQAYKFRHTYVPPKGCNFTICNVILREINLDQLERLTHFIIHVFDKIAKEPTEIGFYPTYKIKRLPNAWQAQEYKPKETAFTSS
jgi:hypothetical protein